MVNYDRIISTVAGSIKPSGIRRFFDLIEGRSDVVALTVGQPDFKTPWHIRQAGIDSITAGKTYYTSNSGMPELRKEIAAYLNRRFTLDYSDNEIIVTVGGSEAIDIALRTIINPGDEIIIPAPCFVCYEPLTLLSGAVPVSIQTLSDDDFKLTPEALKAVITQKTKALILPYPNNPTGAIMTKTELEAIAKVLNGTDIIVIADEIYAELTFGTVHTSIASIEGMKERTIIVSGLSKAYAMTGWRIGYCAAPHELISVMLKIHQYAIMCASTASQYAAIEALKFGDSDIESMKDEYNRRRRYIYNGLKSIGSVCVEPKGAFYIYPSIKKFKLSSADFCSRLLDEQNAAIIPGTAFGSCGEGYVRISYAYSVTHITKALERIEKFISSL